MLFWTSACLLIWNLSFLQEHNWERWRQKLTLIQKSEVAAVVSGATVGFHLVAGTEHDVVSSAVVEHLVQWRERTQAAAVDARAAIDACRILSVDAADDGR